MKIAEKSDDNIDPWAGERNRDLFSIYFTHHILTLTGTVTRCVFEKSPKM
jgi:hypothetical protein